MSVIVTNRLFTKATNTQQTNYLLAAKDDVLDLQYDTNITFGVSGQTSQPIQIVSANTLAISGANWSSYGVLEGDTIIIIGDAPSGVISVSVTVISLSGNTLIHSGSLGSIGQYFPWNDGTNNGNLTILPNVTTVEGLDVFFNLVPNSGGNQQSLIDNEVNNVRFLTTGLAIGSSVNGTTLGNKSGGLIIESETTRLTPLAGYSFSFRIRIRFWNWLSFEEADLETPIWYAGVNSIKPFTETRVLRQLTNPNSLISIVDSFNQGNVGYYNQNYNQGLNPFTVTALTFENLAGDPTDGIDFIIPTVVNLTVTGTGAFQNGYLLSLYNVPFDDRYKNNLNTWGQNVLLAGVLTGAPFNYPLNGAAWTFSNITYDNSVSGTISMEFRITPNAALTTLFQGFGDGDRWLRLSLTLQTTAGSATNNDRTTLLLSEAEAISVAPVGGVADEVQFVNFRAHSVAPDGDPVMIIPAMTEDDILVKGLLRMDRDEDYQSVSLKFQVQNNTTGAAFNLFQRTVNFANSFSNAGVFYVDHIENLGYELPSLGRNFFGLQWVSEDSTTFDLELTHTLLLSWRYWNARPDALASFFNLALPNNGLNDEWVRYAMTGFSFVVRVEIVKDGLTYYSNHPITIADYDSDTTTTVISLEDMDGNPLPAILSDQNVVVKAVHTSGLGWNPDDTWGWIAIRPRENEPRRLISSAWNWTSANLPLQPLDGQLGCELTFPTPTQAVLKAVINSGLVQANSTLVSRIQSPKIGVRFNLDLASSVPWADNGLGTEGDLSTFFGGADVLGFQTWIDALGEHRLQALVLNNTVNPIDLTIMDITNVYIYQVEGHNTLKFNDNDIEDLSSTEIFLPDELTNIVFQDNNFTDYSLSEDWANAQPPFTNPCIISFVGNPVTPIGTNFETIMLTKNATLTY